MLEHVPARPAASGVSAPHVRAGTARRVRGSHMEWVAERLSARDWRIIETVNRLRLVSGSQLERLHFGTLVGHSRAVVRGRVLRRLVSWRVLAVLPRRVGGAARGSSGSVFALGSVGARLIAERQAAKATPPRVRHPAVPTERTVRHTLAVTELYVSLVDEARAMGARLTTFEAEPASWWPDGLGGYVKPDAYAALELAGVREHWWVEVDLATGSLPTMKRKLTTYLHFVERGQLGPRGVVPRVLISTVSPARRDALHAIVARLPEPAGALFLVARSQEAAAMVLRSLRE